MALVTTSVDVTDADFRTTKLNGEGRVSYEFQKAYMPPPSAAAFGSAGFPTCRN